MVSHVIHKSPDGDLYLNQPGRAFAIAIAWSVAAASSLSVTAAIVLILVARFGVQDRYWVTVLLSVCMALLWLGFFMLGLTALLIAAVTVMVGRRTVAKPAVRLRSGAHR